MAVKVKICGITSADDATQAIHAGADALGLVFYPPSPRYIDTETAATIARSVGPFTILTGLFVNAAAAEIEQTLSAVPLNLLQFHGDEDGSFCDSIGLPYTKVIRVKADTDILREIDCFPNARGFLLDTWKASQYGGTGSVFDWGMIPPDLDRPVILAGGLTPDNVAAAIAAVKPYGVDVSGGVELAPGKKSADAVKRFIANVRQTDCDYPA